MNRSALISPCGQFRYRLDRAWDPARPRACFVMLNPSTADADQDDPTIRKCIGFAERLGFGALVVANLFAYRATDPKDLKRAGFMVGPENDEAILCAASDSNVTICAWGAHARGLVRPLEVIEQLHARGIKPKALALTADGIPRHPLMLRYGATLLDVPGGVR